MKNNLPKPFNPLDYSEVLFLEPGKLSDVTSWHEHIPFAFMLMQMLSPKVFVELGTHKGDSYFAFCQAVKALMLGTKCYAVDTWKGEEHAGYYDESVYTELKTYHDQNYAAFSTLIKSTFDEALQKFADKSIDLLHIDGLHTYEAVKHDFETWLPKMSNAGVILFHDTNVREHDFGVWKLWEEVKNRYPSFEFEFGHGLGVIAVGGTISEPMQTFLSESKRNSHAISRLFYLLSRQFGLKKLITEKDRALVEKDKQIAEQCAEQNRQIIEKDRTLAEKDRTLAGLTAQVQALKNSLSWKITAPLRSIRGFFK